MPKQIVTGRMKSTRKRGRPQKTRTDAVGKDLQTMGIGNWRTVGRDWEEWRKLY
jgi:hypothetical protein